MLPYPPCVRHDAPQRKDNSVRSIIYAASMFFFVSQNLRTPFTRELGAHLLVAQAAVALQAPPLPCTH